MNLTGKQKRHLHGLGHDLHPLVTVGGNGISDGVLAELDQTLEHHELIKIKVGARDREERKELIEELVAKSGALLVQTIGHTALLYRKAKKPSLQIPR